MPKKITLQKLVHEFAKSHANELELGNYENDLKLFESLHPNREVKYPTFKYYMREMTDPTFSKYKGGSAGQAIITKTSEKEREKIVYR